MLARYQIVRGKRASNNPLPDGVRQDTRRHTQHCLRPARSAVDSYLADPTTEAWRLFEREYSAALEERWTEDPGPFEQLAQLAEERSVFLGCNCPTRKNPDVRRCHTVLALRFMENRYPGLQVIYPDER